MGGWDMKQLGNTVAALAQTNAQLTQLLKETRDGFADSLTREDLLRRRVEQLEARLAKPAEL